MSGGSTSTPASSARIGYFTHPDARGTGITREALALAVRHCFVPEEDGGLGQRVKAFTTIANAGSRRLVEASGFTQYGVERLGAWVRAGRVDMALYDVLAAERRSSR